MKNYSPINSTIFSEHDNNVEFPTELQRLREDRKNLQLEIIELKQEARNTFEKLNKLFDEIKTTINEYAR